jgi:hypothetical protein
MDIMLEMTIMGEIVKTSYVFRMNAVSYNSLEKINFPSDLDRYELSQNPNDNST